MRQMGSVKAILAAAMLAVSMLTSLTGCGMVQRVKYELSGAGLEEWEDAAVESGVASSVEEYYYDHLPEDYHEAYREIYVHLMKNEDSGSFMTSITAEDFWRVYYAVLADHPEIFWIGTSAQVEESALSGKVISYEFEVTVPLESRASMRESLEAAADECISQISQDATAYQKIKFVYEYLIRTVDYNSGSQDSQNIQSALLYHSSVCAGYSKAFAYILHRMGLFCTYITGTIKGGGDHGWNMTRIDGQYYYVDVTWGDPVFANQMDGGDGSMINYNYLCCTQDDLFKTHTPGDFVELPSCTSDDYNYYKLYGYYYEDFDWDGVYNALMNSVWNDESGIAIKFGSQEALQTAAYEIFEDGLINDAGQYLMNVNGVTNWNYKYHTDDDFCVITIYWK